MNIKIINSIKLPSFDERVDSRCYYLQLSIKDYLSMIDLDGNPYQRSLLDSKLYRKLIKDILEGAVFPAISVVYPDKVNLAKGFDKKKKFRILDGLQRTNCLFTCIEIIKDPSLFSKTRSDEEERLNLFYKTEREFYNRIITLEVWEKLDLKAILYKIVVLNTGQRRMDTRHQLDILLYSLKDTLVDDNIQVIRLKEKEEEEINFKNLYNSNIYPLSTIAEALVSYLNKLPAYSAKDAADFLFETLSLGEDEFANLLRKIEKNETYDDLKWTLKTLGKKILEKYEYNVMIKYGLFMSGFMAAIGKSRDIVDKKNIEIKKQLLLKKFDRLDDPLDLKNFETYYNKFKSGIGVKRRKLVFKAFTNYFSSKINNEINWREAYSETEGRN